MFTANNGNKYNTQRARVKTQPVTQMRPPKYSSYNQTCFFFLFLIESARMHKSLYHSNE